MNNFQTTESTVMRRVRMVHTLRPLVSTGAIALAVLLFALWGIGREVWVAKVFSNGPQDFVGHLAYLSYAFDHTRISVQALCAAAFLAMLFFFRDLFRGVALIPSLKRT